MNSVRDYELLEQVGSGSFATVYKARHKVTNQIYAIKKMKQMPRNDAIVVQNQIELLKRIRHRNIIHFVTDFKEKGKWYLVFQYCGKGDLQRFRKKNGKIPQEFAKNIFINIIEAVAILHENKIVHRDLKLANILINDSFEIKLADFGFSKDFQAGLMTSYCGTPLTMAPQILQRQSYDQRCDTWSLGVLLYQLIYNKAPFLPNKQFGQGIIGLTNAVLKGRPVFDEDIQISPQCKDIILKCLQKKMKNRQTANELKIHKWFSAGIRSTIRFKYLKQSISDDLEATVKCKAVLNQAARESLKKTLQKSFLTDSGIKKTLKSLCDCYPENQRIQILFLLKVVKVLSQISSSRLKLKIQGKQFKGKQFSLKLGQMSKFKQHSENLKQFLTKQIKCRSSLTKKDVNLEKEIVKFLVANATECLINQEKTSQNIKILSDLSQLCNTQIQCTIATLNWCLNQDFENQRVQYETYLQKQNDGTIKELINGIEEEQIYDSEVKSNWLIEYDFQIKSKTGLEFLLGSIINKVIKINTQVSLIKVEEVQ